MVGDPNDQPRRNATYHSRETVQTTGASSLTQTNNFHAWAKLMRDGVPSDPRLIKTFPPPFPGLRFEKVVAFSRASHMMPRKAVEERIAATFPKAPAKRKRHKGKRNADIG